MPRGAMQRPRCAPGTSAPAALAALAARPLAVATTSAAGLSATLAALAAKVRSQLLHGHCPGHHCREQHLRQPDRLGGCKRGDC